MLYPIYDFSFMLLYLLQGITYGFAAAVQPGPLQTYLVSQTLRNGRRRTLPAILAPLVSDGPIIVLTLAVLSTFPSWLVQALRLIGGLFILYLAAGALRSWHRNDVAQPDEGSGRKSVMSAALVNLFNPNVYLYWAVVMGPLLITGWREQPLNGVGLLAGFYGTMLMTLAGLIWVFGLAGLRGERLNRALLGLSGIALAGFGLYQIFLGFSHIS